LQVTGSEPCVVDSQTARSVPWEECWLNLAGGRMRYLKAGAGRPLILVHGLLGYSFSWRFTIPAVAPYATVYAIDNLGAGFSLAPDGMNCSIRSTAERVLQFADMIGLTEFDLLGTSHGGAAAMMVAAVCVERKAGNLRRLVLVAPVNPWSPHGRRLAPFLGSAAGSFLFRKTVARWRSLDYLWLRRVFGDGAKIPADSLDGYRLPVLQNHAFEHGLRIVRSWTADLVELEGRLTDGPRLRDIDHVGCEGPRGFGALRRATSPELPQRGIGHIPRSWTPAIRRVPQRVQPGTDPVPHCPPIKQFDSIASQLVFAAFLSGSGLRKPVVISASPMTSEHLRVSAESESRD